MTAIATGEGFPTLEGADYGPIYGFLSTAAAGVNSLPSDISGIVPNINNAGSLFGYVKWALSCASIQELTGATLAPIFCHTFVGLSMSVVVSGVLLTIRLVRLMVKVVNWLIAQVLKFIPMMG